ncbi:MAG: VWA domain-containing protein [Planctomycetaceae bacterium]
MSFPDDHDESSAIGWISFSDLLMVGLIVLLLSVADLSISRVQLESRARQAELNLEREIVSNREKLAKAEEALRKQDSLATEIERLNFELAAARKQAEHYLAEIARLSTVEMDLVDKSRQLTEAAAELQRALKLLEETKAELLVARQELNSAQLQLSNANQKLAESEMRLVEREKELTALKKYIAEAKIPDEKQLTLWRSIEKENTSLKEQIGKLMGELEAARKESMRLLTVVSDLETELKKQRADQIGAEVREQGFRQELLGIRTRNSGYGRVVFVVDCSGSMVRSSNTSDESRWDYVQTVIRNWLLLLPFQEVQLILFNNDVDVHPLPGEFISLKKTAESRRLDIQPLLTALKNTVPNQGTNTSLALQTAYEAEDVDAIFLFTDGQPMLKAEVDTTSEDFRTLQNEVLDLIIREKQRGNAPPINVIGLGDYFSNRLAGPEQKHLPFGVFLTRIAQLSGGTFLGR